MLRFFCILQKLLNEFLVHVKKNIYIYLLKTVQARKKINFDKILVPKIQLS